jgi:hypothetical protein
MKAFRCVLLLVLIFSLVMLSHAPGSCKSRLKIKLPVNVGVTMSPQPLAGSQESVMMTNTKKSDAPVMAKSPSIEPVRWAGEAQESPHQEETPGLRPPTPSQSPELTFTPTGEQGERAVTRKANEDDSAASMSYRTCPVDFSQIVEGKKDAFVAKNDFTSVHSLVAKLNDDIFNHYREGLRLDSWSGEKTRFDSPPPLAPGEADRMVLYRGFRMTARTAQYFRILESLIQRSLPGRNIIITSTTGGTHLDARHYQGKAVDFVVEKLTIKESIYLEYLATQAGLVPFNEYVYSSPYKTGNHMHVDLME